MKTTLGMDVLRCQTEAGVRREVVMYAVVYNLVRVVMWEAGRRQGVRPDRISFIDALGWLSSAPPGTPLPVFVVNPVRPPRIEPRCAEAASEEVPVHDPPPTRAPRRVAPPNASLCESTSPLPSLYSQHSPPIF